MTDTTATTEPVPETAAVTLAIAAPAEAAEPAAAVITLDGDNDWLAAAAAHRRSHPRRAFDANRPGQVDRALQFLWYWAQTSDDDTPRRAAVIVAALPGAPRSERIFGVRPSGSHVPELPEALRKILARDGFDVPVPVIEPTAVTKRRARSHAKAAESDAKAAADGTEAEAGT
jgi:hypothetical protein